MIDFFEDLLNQLSKYIQIPLHPDKNGACLLNINNEIRVQIEWHESKHALLFASLLGEIAPGKFREKVLLDALKANFLTPKGGLFFYMPRNNNLCLFSFIPEQIIEIHSLVDSLAEFIQKASDWKKGILRGSTSFLIQAPPSEKPTLESLLKP